LEACGCLSREHGTPIRTVGFVGDDVSCYASTMTLSVLIVEDDLRFRDAFARAVSQAGDMTLIGSAADYASGLAQLDKSPDVLLVDLQLPDGNGIDLIREATRRIPACDVMVVTIFGDERHVLDSIEAGATGYLLKDLAPQELVEQIRILRAGGSPISPIIARQLLTRFSAQMPAPKSGAVEQALDKSPLSEQEIKVLTLSAKGFSYDEIAGLMQVSRHTVQTYVKRSYVKLQVNSKVEALSEARRLCILSE
jgi:DNA-binding NarL/FixJ family response regulator